MVNLTEDKEGDRSLPLLNALSRYCAPGWAMGVAARRREEEYHDEHVIVV
jgi:hypothetical protein